MTSPPTSEETEAASPWRFVAGLAAAFGVAAVLWRLTPLAALLDPRHLAALGRALREHPAAPALVLLAYVAAAGTLFPVTLLLAATALVFEPGPALALGLSGALLAAALTFGAGRVVARHRPRWLLGPRARRLRARLERRGVLTMATVRLVPIGSFSLSNVVAGALGIPFRDFMLGNALGVLPGLLLLTFGADAARRLGWALP
jgi:phospholipase D1/2